MSALVRLSRFEEEHRFIVEKGRIEVMAGTSSADIKLRTIISVVD